MPEQNTPDQPQSTTVIDRKSVKALLASSDEASQHWLIEGLIREGDQVVLAGAPKSGKSFLAFQMALAVATGCNHRGLPWFLFENFKLPSSGDPHKVLFFSLEMGAGVMRSRLVPWKGLALPQGLTSIEDIENLEFVFSIDGRSTLALDDEKSIAYEAVRAVIEEAKPHLVIFDTFVRVHSLDENDNVSMAKLMDNLAALCVTPDATAPNKKRKVAHVIIHHLRKPGMERWRNQSVIDAVRGAGSIIGAADLVLGMASSDSGTTLEFCCRHLPPIDDKKLTSNPDGEGPVVFEEAPRSPAEDRRPKGKQDKKQENAIEAAKAALAGLGGVIKKVTIGELQEFIPAERRVSPEMLIKHASRAETADWKFHPAKNGGKSIRQNFWERTSPHP